MSESADAARTALYAAGFEAGRVLVRPWFDGVSVVLLDDDAARAEAALAAAGWSVVLAGDRVVLAWNRVDEPS